MAAVLLKRASPTVWFSRCVNFNCNLSALKIVQADTKTVLQSNFARSVSGCSVRNGSVLSWLPKKATGCRCIPKGLSQQYSSVFIKPQRKHVFKCNGVEIPRLEQVRNLPTLNQIRRHKPRTKKRRPKKEIPRDKRILLGPQRKGVCVKLVVRTPKKPNSAQRKCAVLRLSNGKLITAYIPGEKGVLQEHGVVLFEGGRVQDCPGIKYKIIRRKYDMN